MDRIIAFLIPIIAWGSRIATNGAMNYANPYNYYGRTVPMQQKYLSSPIQYGAYQRTPNSLPVRRAYYPAMQTTPRHTSYNPVQLRTSSALPRTFGATQPKMYTPVGQRLYAAVQPRNYAPVQSRTYAPVQPRTYALAQPRVYVPIKPHTLAPVLPRTYAAVQPQTGYALLHPSAYAHSSAAARPDVQRSQLYPTQAKPRVAYYVPVRQPVTSSFAQQPIRNAAVQKPVTRAFNPKFQFYRNGAFPAAYSRHYVPVLRPGAPTRLVAYGRNKIPKNPSGIPRNLASQTKNPSKTTIQSSNSKRNRIATGEHSNLQQPQRMQTTRNQINDITLPNKFVVKSHSPVRPIEPTINTDNAPKLSSFLKHVKNLRDAFKGNSMRQGITFYNDDVTNKTRHRPTSFAAPTRKLGSQGAPGGSQVTLINENQIGINQNAIQVNQPGSRRTDIETNEKNLKNPPKNAAVQSDAILDNKQNLGTNGQSKTIASRPLMQHTTGSVEHSKSKSVENPKVNLELLKQKVLHSNNTRFLKRVLQVLRKYTKLMRNSMGERNKTSGLGTSVKEPFLNTSSTNNAQQKDKNLKSEGSRKVSENSKKEQNENGADNKSSLGNSEKIEPGIEENPAKFAKVLNSTRTAIKIFDLLNSAPRNISEKTSDKGKSQAKPNSEKSVTTGSDSVISQSKSEKSSLKNQDSKMKDENASKKAVIETERNVGKPMFDVQKLKYGLERGNTIE